MTRSPLSSPPGRSLHLLAHASSGQSESRRASASRDRSRSTSRERPRTRYSSRRRSSRSRARDRSDSRSSSRSRSPSRSRSRCRHRSRSARRSRSRSRNRHAHAQESRASDGVSRGGSGAVADGYLSSPTRAVSPPHADRKRERQLATRDDGPSSPSGRQRPAPPHEHRRVVPSKAPQHTTTPATLSSDEMGATRGQASPRQWPTQPTHQDPRGEQNFRKRKRMGNTKLYWNGYEYTRATVTTMKTTYRCSFYRGESCTARLVYLAGERDYDYGNHVPHTCTRRIQTSASFRPATADVSALMEAEVDRLARTQSLSPAEVWYAVSTKFLYGAAVPVFGLSRVEVFKRFESMRLIYCGKCIHGKVKAPRPAQEEAHATTAPQSPLLPDSSVNANVAMPSSPLRSPSARQLYSPSTRREGSFEVKQENFFPTQANTVGVDELGTNPTAISVPHAPTFSSNEPTVLFTDDPEAFHYHIAVHECGGELSQFTELVEMIDASTCDPTATILMELCDETRTREALCAAEYAYRRGFAEVGDLLASHMMNAPEFDKAPASSVELVESDEDFPFIAAVDESQGDVEECGQFLELVDEQDHALDAAIQADVVRGTRQSVQWSAVEYACHLGYVDVVKYLLKETVFKDSMPMKAKFQMLKSARERSVRLGTISRTSV